MERGHRNIVDGLQPAHVYEIEEHFDFKKENSIW